MLAPGAVDFSDLAQKKTIALDVTIGMEATTQRLKELRQTASMTQFEIDVSLRVCALRVRVISGWGAETSCLWLLL